MLHLLPFVEDESREMISLYLTCKSFQHLIRHDPVTRQKLAYGMRERALLYMEFAQSKDTFFIPEYAFVRLISHLLPDNATHITRKAV